MVGATEVFAGVTHGNDKSGAVLTRLGFKVAETLETYTRYHRPSSPRPARIPHNGEIGPNRPPWGERTRHRPIASVAPSGRRTSAVTAAASRRRTGVPVRRCATARSHEHSGEQSGSGTDWVGGNPVRGVEASTVMRWKAGD
ncbi:hypothetical protein GCM10019016_103030 [Streptomyces prasinosporus]|uniref:N-acetyltransferase domain-containing protein n=1 Tax=Streptomyces prasinosporus TaxID=68256 RepID=A0ABP6U669_9ACTN